MRGFEEYQSTSRLVAWILIGLLSATLIGYALIIHHVVPDRPREWDFGALPTTPAESVYSTHEPPSGARARQIVPLPEYDGRTGGRTKSETGEGS